MFNTPSDSAPSLLIVSENPDDIRMGEFVAMTLGLTPSQAVTPSVLTSTLQTEKPELVFWDADAGETSAQWLSILMDSQLLTERIFAFSNGDFFHSEFWEPKLKAVIEAKRPVPFHHHIWRRFDEPLPFILSRLAGSLLRKNESASSPNGQGSLQLFFPEDCWKQTLPIHRSSHRRPAVTALEKVLSDHKVPKRLASLVASAADELLLNAIYEAPVLRRAGAPRGTEIHYQRVFDRSKDMELQERERVALELATTGSYLGIMVRDQWGSLPHTVLDALFQSEGESASNASGAGKHGLLSVVGSGISIRAHVVPDKLTEVALFIPTGVSFKDFRGGMRFLSMQRAQD
jgi:hypothetical protein